MAAGKIEKRARWLSSNVFPDRPIDDEAIAAMSGMGVPRAKELFKEIEEKGDQCRNPSGYLKGAARREGFGPAIGESKGGGKKRQREDGGGGKGSGGKGKSENFEYDKVTRRA